MMESFKSPQVLQQKRSDDALSVGSDSAYSTDSGGKIMFKDRAIASDYNVTKFSYGAKWLIADS